MGIGTELRASSKAIYIWLSALILTLTSTEQAYSYVNTQLKEFSHPEPLKKPKVIEIYHREPLEDPGEALIWDAPPYHAQAQILSKSEEDKRKDKALNLLIEAALVNDPQLRAAKNKIKRKQIGNLALNLLERLSSYENSTATSTEAEQYIAKTISEIKKQFAVYHKSFFKSSRNSEWLASIANARSYLAYTCSELALKEIDNIYLGDTGETQF